MTATYSLTSINVQGDEQEAYEVYADESREQTIAFCFDEDTARLIAAAPELLEALNLYIKLDNDHRAGCKIEPEDWAECYQVGTTAIAKAGKGS